MEVILNVKMNLINLVSDIIEENKNLVYVDILNENELYGMGKLLTIPVPSKIDVFKTRHCELNMNRQICKSVDRHGYGIPKGCYRDNEPNHAPIKDFDIVNSFNNKIDNIVNSISNGVFRQYYLDKKPQFLGLFKDGNDPNKIFYLVLLEMIKPFEYSIRIESVRRNNYRKDLNTKWINENRQYEKEYDKTKNRITTKIATYTPIINTKVNFILSKRVKAFIKSNQFRMKFYPDEEIDPQILIYKTIRDNLSEILRKNKDQESGVYELKDRGLRIEYQLFKNYSRTVPEVTLQLTKIKKLEKNE